jgi:hypothetical protein
MGRWAVRESRGRSEWTNERAVRTHEIRPQRDGGKLFGHPLGGDGRHRAGSVGVASHVKRRLTTRELAWPEGVAVMEVKHLELIRSQRPRRSQKVVVSDVPDLYEPSESEHRAHPVP